MGGRLTPEACLVYNVGLGVDFAILDSGKRSKSWNIGISCDIIKEFIFDVFLKFAQKKNKH